MTMVTTISLEEFLEGIEYDDPEDTRNMREQYQRIGQRAFDRGDVLVVYINDDLSHPDLGLTQVCSYGSAESMLERTQFPEPPTTLPDIGGAINWRYQLHHIIDRRWR